MRYQVGGDVQEFAKQMFYIAWKACGGTLGMGFLQDKPGATADDVLNNIFGWGDYPGPSHHPNRDEGTALRADYVFGRMMKITATLGSDWIELPDDDPAPDYQAWCRKYRSYKDLLHATAEETQIGISSKNS